eukprot:4072747-Prymnesium_polylepis.1
MPAASRSSWTRRPVWSLAWQLPANRPSHRQGAAGIATRSEASQPERDGMVMSRARLEAMPRRSQSMRSWHAFGIAPDAETSSRPNADTTIRLARARM